MKIIKFVPFNEQYSTSGNYRWSVVRLVKLSEHLPIMEIPLDHLNIYHDFKEVTLREMVMHMNAVDKCDLSYPIILDHDGDIMDGRHRVVKAILTGQKTIKAVRFEDNPTPCEILD